MPSKTNEIFCCCNWLKASGEEDSFKIRTLFSLFSDYLLLKAELDFYLNKLKVFSRGCIQPCSIAIGLVSLEEKIFITHNHFSLLPHYLLFE